MKNKLQLFGLSLALALVMTACGGSSSTDDQSLAGSGGSSSSGGGSGTGSGGGTTVVSATPTPTPAPAGSTTDSGAPYTYDFSITGAGGTSPTYKSPDVVTDTKLRVRVTAGAAGTLSLADGSYSRFEATYGCVSYKVTVAGKTVQTNPLNVGGNFSFCPTASSSQILDFSDRMTSGHGPVHVEVTAPKYDFYCMFYYGTAYQALYCPMTSVYKNHTVTGTIDIEVNGTSL